MNHEERFKVVMRGTQRGRGDPADDQRPAVSDSRYWWFNAPSGRDGADHERLRQWLQLSYGCDHTALVVERNAGQAKATTWDHTKLSDFPPAERELTQAEWEWLLRSWPSDLWEHESGRIFGLLAPERLRPELEAR